MLLCWIRGTIRGPAIPVLRLSSMTKPTLEEIAAYCDQRHPSVDPVAFFLHYETNGWMVGKVPMKNWRAGVANWDRMQQTRNGGNGHAKLQTFAELDATNTIEAARRIRNDLARAGENVPTLTQAHERGIPAPNPQRPRLLSGQSD